MSNCSKWSIDLSSDVLLKKTGFAKFKSYEKTAGKEILAIFEML